MNIVSAPSFRPEYVGFFELFNRRAYFEAHEVLETLWLATRDEKRDFYKGLIQTAAAFLKLEQGKLEPAGRLAARALSHLERYPGTFEGLDLGRVTQLLRDVGAGRNPLTGELPRLELTGL